MFKFIILIFVLITTVHAREVRVTGNPDYPPVIWNRNGELVGSAVTIVKKALENLGYQIKLIPFDSWGKAQERAHLGEVDILLPPYKTPERELKYDFPKTPFLMDKTALFFKKGRVIDFESIKSLKKFSGVAITNESFGAEFDATDKKLGLLKRLDSADACFKQLLSGKVDYVIAGQNASSVELAKLAIEDKVEMHENLIVKTGMYTAISKKSRFNNDDFKRKFYNEVEKLISMKLDLKATLDALELVNSVD